MKHITENSLAPLDSPLEGIPEALLRTPMPLEEMQSDLLWLRIYGRGRLRSGRGSPKVIQ